LGQCKKRINYFGTSPVSGHRPSFIRSHLVKLARSQSHSPFPVRTWIVYTNSEQASGQGALIASPPLGPPRCMPPTGLRQRCLPARCDISGQARYKLDNTARLAPLADSKPHGTATPAFRMPAGCSPVDDLVPDFVVDATRQSLHMSRDQLPSAPPKDQEVSSEGLRVLLSKRAEAILPLFAGGEALPITVIFPLTGADLDGIYQKGTCRGKWAAHRVASFTAAT
jgi:hypothetical protein